MFNFKYTRKHLKNWTGCYYYNRWSILGMQNMITGMIERGNEKDAYKNMYDREMKWVTYENRNEWEKKTTKMLIANSSLGKSFYPLNSTMSALVHLLSSGLWPQSLMTYNCIILLQISLHDIPTQYPIH